MKVSGRISLVLACLLVCFTLWQLPARVVGVLLPERLMLSALSGSFWSGTAARSAWLLDDGALVLGRVRWHLSPLSLVSLRPKVLMSLAWGGQQLNGVFRRNLSGNIVVTDFHAEFDSGLIRQMVPLYIGGRVVADFSEVLIASHQLQSLDGKVLWQDAVWAAAAGDVPLGDYQLRLSGQDSNVQGRVTTLSGGLVVAGDLEVTENNYEIDFDLSGPATANAELARALQLIAAPTATGFDMVINGRL